MCTKGDVDRCTVLFLNLLAGLKHRFASALKIFYFSFVYMSNYLLYEWVVHNSKYEETNVQQAL